MIMETPWKKSSSSKKHNRETAEHSAVFCVMEVIMSEIKNYIWSHKDEMIRLLRELVAVPSVQAEAEDQHQKN